MDDIRDVKIKGGIHPRDGKEYICQTLTVMELEALSAELATVINKYARNGAWINVVYTVTHGHKID